METRRILLDGAPGVVARDGDELVTADGRRIRAMEAEHLPPTEPTKIVCVHLNYESRVREFGATMPPAPTYFHKPVSALNALSGRCLPAWLALIPRRGALGDVRRRPAS